MTWPSTVGVSRPPTQGIRLEAGGAAKGSGRIDLKGVLVCFRMGHGFKKPAATLYLGEAHDDGVGERSIARWPKNSTPRRKNLLATTGTRAAQQRRAFLNLGRLYFG
jgi:hypothetical protein